MSNHVAGNPEKAAEVPATGALENKRLASLDQFRGYTVLGMFLVNFVGSYTAVQAALPLLKHHHTFCSYADTIMPQFLFAVGFAFRLTFLRRAQKAGTGSAYTHAMQRNLGLLLVAFVVHHLDGQFESWSRLTETGFTGFIQTAFQRNFFQTLAHIAVTSLWVMPVINARATWRILFAIGSAVLFHTLSEWDRTNYYGWVMKRPGIDGGPLGFLTWTTPLILGTLAYDITAKGRYLVVKLLALGMFVMVLGYGLSCLNLVTPPNEMTSSGDWKQLLIEPPFVKPTRPVNIWTMSQRAGSVCYLVFGGGFATALFALFVAVCDYGSLSIPIFRTLGSNALVGYILHDLVNDAVKPFVPKDSPLFFVFIGFAVSLGICYLFLRHLEKHHLYLRL